MTQVLEYFSSKHEALNSATALPNESVAFLYTNN
jgi:hypothetical protein